MTHSLTSVNSQTESLLNGGKAGWNSTIILQGTSVQLPPSPPQGDCHLLQQLYPTASDQSLFKREHESITFGGEVKSQGNGSKVEGKQRGKDDKHMQCGTLLLHDVVLRGLKPNRCTQGDQTKGILQQLCLGTGDQMVD